MLKQVCLKYVFLGNVNVKKYISDYPFLNSTSYAKEAKTIFDNVNKYDKIAYEERNRIDDLDNHSYYYFTTTLSGIFYLVYADLDYQEYLINEFLEEIQKEGLNLNLDERGELNRFGKERLKSIFEKYKYPKNASSVAAAHAELNQVKLDMKNNINNMVNNMEDIKNLDDKSKKIQDGSKVYMKDAKALERETWWRNFKWTVIIILLVIGILLIIILPLALKQSDNSKSGSQITSQPNSTKLLN